MYDWGISWSWGRFFLVEVAHIDVIYLLSCYLNQKYRCTCLLLWRVGCNTERANRTPKQMYTNVTYIYMGYKIMVHWSSLVIVNFQEFSFKNPASCRCFLWNKQAPPASWSSRGLQLCEDTQPTFKVGHFRKLNAPGRPSSVSRFKYLQASASFWLVNICIGCIGI